MYDSERGDIRIVAVGDVMPTRRLTAYEEPDYLGVLELLRRADCTIGNLETTVRDSQEGNPNITTGTVMSTPPYLLPELKWMGLDLVSASNNHSCDYGVAGVSAMIRHLRAAELPFAGIGNTLTEARAAGFFDSRNGRVGLVSATTFFAAHARAGDSRPDSPGRPGINPLRFNKIHTVDERGMAEISRLKAALGLDVAQKQRAAHFYSSAEAPLDTPEETVFLDSRFKKGTEFRISTTVNKEDADGNLRQIRDAKRRADWVVFAFHNHELTQAGAENAKSKADLGEAADFVLEFSRAAIDAGADVIAGHGPHVPFGVEIYKGRPILYSLGNFVFANDSVDSFPAEAYGRFGMPIDSTPADFIDERSAHGTRGFDAAEGFWHGIAAECVFRANKLAELTLHPIDLGFGRRRSERGRPMIGHGKMAQTALERVQRLSARLGTDIVIKGDIGVVTLG